MNLPVPRPRVPLAGVALAAALGVALADCWETAPAWGLCGLGIAGIALCFRPRTMLCWIFVALGFFSLHTLRFHGSQARLLAEDFRGGRRAVQAVGIVWSEPQKPAIWSRLVTCHFVMKLESLEIGGVQAPADALMQIRWDGDVPVYGDRVEIAGGAENVAPPRNPAEFDFAAYQRRQGIQTEIVARYGSDCRILGHGFGNPLQTFAFSAQAWIRKHLEADLGDSPEVFPVIESMILGIHGDTPEDLKDLFQRTGTIHLLAVSGLNFAILASLGWFFLKPLQFSRRAAVFVIIPFLALDALVTGLRASCVRATIMAALYLGGQLFDRRAVAYNSLSAAAVAILAWDTNQLFSAGFQFSFGVVFIVIWLASAVQRWLNPLGQPDAFLPRPLWTWRQKARSVAWQFLASSLGVSIASFLASIPFTAGYFHLLSPGSVLANLLAVPFAFVIVGLALASLLASAIWAPLAIFFNNANWACATWLLAVLRFFAAMPAGYVYLDHPSLPRAAPCEVTVFDLGAGGASWVRAGGADWLIDSGHGYEYGHVVLPYLRSRGVNQLDGLIITHGSAPHMGGAATAFHDFAPAVVADSPLKDRSTARRELHALLAERQFGKRIVQRDDILQLGPGASLRVLYPPAGIPAAIADDKVVVLLLQAEGARVLFMSDSGYSTEQWLLQNEPDLQADLLVKGQHSRDLSGTPDFLARVHPQAIICAPPRQGPPAGLNSWAEGARARGAMLFRQDETGAVHVTLRAGEIRVEGFLNGQTLRSRAR